MEEPEEVESERQKSESEYDEVSSSRPWYFTNGERYPKPARINKKTKKRLAKLIPSDDVRSDRITNQLMYVPPNYEEIKNEGRVKTILLYNGLGPWNVKQGDDSTLFVVKRFFSLFSCNIFKADRSSQTPNVPSTHAK